MVSHDVIVIILSTRRKKLVVPAMLYKGLYTEGRLSAEKKTSAKREKLGVNGVQAPGYTSAAELML